MQTQWYWVQGRLPASHPGLKAYAVFGGNAPRLPLPVSLKGFLLEVIPAPSAAFTIEVLDDAGLPVPGDIQVKRISALNARFLMLRRVAAALLRLDRAQRRRMRLGWLSLLHNLPQAYRFVGSLRYHFPATDYGEWFARYWTLQAGERRRLQRFMSGPQVKTLPLRIVIDVRGGCAPHDLQRTIDSAQRQLGCCPVITVLEKDSSAMSEWLDDSLVIWLAGGAVLEPWAVAWFVKAALARPSAQLLYSDHDALAADGVLHNPQFKPDWSPDLQLCSHYVGDVVAVRAGLLRIVSAKWGHVPDAYELIAEVGLSGGDIHHIPAVLWHQHGTRSLPTPERLADILRRNAIDASVERDARQHIRIRYAPPAAPPLVSIIIPTRDMLHFLKPCVDSVLAKTTWPRFEVLIVDNQSTCTDTLAYMQQVAADARVRVLRYDHPFNFSAINNFAVAQAQGEVICLLNNDTAVISPDWLDDMVARLGQPGVGVVGARLYFRDGRVQHAGDVIGPGGCAHHLFGILAADDPGYMQRAVLPQDLSAVTAACLVTPKPLFLKLEGLDATNLPVAFNDVDYCLRVREAGLRVVYTPYAELYHYESVSRGKDDSDEKRARSEREVNYMRKRWPDVIEHDPFYNPNLNYARPDCTLGKVPRIDWPW